MLPIATDRLLLRAFTIEDVEALISLDSDPDVRRHLHGPAAPSRSEVEAWVAKLRRTYHEGSRRGYWAAELDGEFIGWFHLRPAADAEDARGACELGYRLVKRVWNRGLATEGARALLDLAWEDREPQVIARTLAENLPSRRVMEKLGMRPVREFQYQDQVAIEYALENPSASG
ncbi:MAG TPA: GNAT family N-acetyltransferase [Fimbriimonadaceae bacterium]|nr:GNAT family N-acetyltransferase [Fimbriimonadaceae bacterium]